MHRLLTLRTTRTLAPHVRMLLRMLVLGVIGFGLTGCGFVAEGDNDEPFGQEDGLSCDPNVYSVQESMVADYADNAAGFDTPTEAADAFWKDEVGRSRNDRAQLEQTVEGKTVEYRDAQGNVILILGIIGSPRTFNVGTMDACAP